MEIRSILVNLDIDFLSPALVKCASDLAQRFGANLIGLAAAEPSAPLVTAEGAVTTLAWYSEERQEIESKLRSLEGSFRALVTPGVAAQYVTSLEAPSRSLAAKACAADLIMASSQRQKRGSYPRNVDLGELVLTAGRPVLVTGVDVDKVLADKIVIGWKDRREARRAVADALPLLKVASEVVVATIKEGEQGLEKTELNDVVAWLHRHDVKARGDIFPATKDSAAESLAAVAAKLQADLIVTGGYGHSRFREWLLGGMTRGLLDNRSITHLMSN